LADRQEGDRSWDAVPRRLVLSGRMLDRGEDANDHDHSSRS
jgi:hypothetical protein